MPKGWFAMVAATLIAGTTGRAGELKLTLAECLDRRYTNEVVTYPLATPAGQCHPSAVRVVGPAGKQAAQLSDIVLWPGTAFVKTARVSFLVAELAPLATNAYTATYAPVPPPDAPPPPADLTVSETPAQAEFVTSRFGVRVALGEQTYDPPAAPTDVPGPVAALRLGDGTWFGGTRLYGAGPVKTRIARLLDRGPVFARAEIAYTYADGNTLTVTVRLNAADYAAQVSAVVAQERADDGWELLLNQGVAIPQAIRIFGSRGYSKEVPFTFDPAAAEPPLFLSPWVGEAWFQENLSLLRLPLAGRGDELQLSVRQAGDWAPVQRDARWLNFTDWGLGAMGRVWTGWREGRVPLGPAAGGVALRANLHAGQRHFTVGAATTEQGNGLLAVYRNQAVGAWTPLPRLNEIKDLVLAWPDAREKHPWLFATGAELAAFGALNASVYAGLRDPALLQQRLAQYCTIKNKLATMEAAARYDALIDTDLVTPAERPLYRARLAYLAYLMADPLHWSYERGYCSGNPNMTVSRYANLGVVAAALRDHPMAATWSKYVLDWMKYWLAEVTDEQGAWVESAHYARVSWSDYVVFALAARQAKWHDFFADAKFRQMALFYEQTLTPPHPGRRIAAPLTAGARQPAWNRARVTAYYGRGTRGDAWGLGGLLAAATATSDPDFSRLMQWSWRESGYSLMASHSTAGLGELLVNRSLPAAAPTDWTSTRYANLGYLLRRRVAQPDEDYLLFVSQFHRSADGEIWPADTGSIVNWYALGRPLGGNFARAPDTGHPLTQCRVNVATNWDPATGTLPKESGLRTTPTHEGFAALPACDYVNVRFDVTELFEHAPITVVKTLPAYPKRERVGAAPLSWRRQVLYVTAPAPGGPRYLVLRDTVSGKQPTQWQFWSLSDKLGTPADTAAREAFLKDQPGNQVAPCRELAGDRFTALGTYGVDLEYYVASPTGSPRYTLRFGTAQGAYGVSGHCAEFQDLLYLQLPGDGAYFVALVPRLATAPAPTFATLGDGTIIRVRGEFGTDYCFLSATPAKAKAEGAAFEGTAGVVQDHATGLTLGLAAAGAVQYRDFGLAAAAPVSASVSPYQLALDFPADAPAATVTMTAPGTWALAGGAGEVKLSSKRGKLTLTVPTNTRTVVLVQAP